jgi:hypothetical protein
MSDEYAQTINHFAERNKDATSDRLCLFSGHYLDMA